MGATHILLFVTASVEENDKNENKYAKKRDKNQSDSKLKGLFDCHLLN